MRRNQEQAVIYIFKSFISEVARRHPHVPTLCHIPEIITPFFSFDPHPPLRSSPFPPAAPPPPPPLPPLIMCFFN